MRFDTLSLQALLVLLSTYYYNLSVSINYGSPYRGYTGFWALDENNKAWPWGHNDMRPYKAG